jgi:hypothetical protein
MAVSVAGAASDGEELPPRVLNERERREQAEKEAEAARIAHELAERERTKEEERVAAAARFAAEEEEREREREQAKQEKKLQREAARSAPKPAPQVQQVQPPAMQAQQVQQPPPQPPQPPQPLPQPLRQPLQQPMQQQQQQQQPMQQQQPLQQQQQPPGLGGTGQVQAKWTQSKVPPEVETPVVSWGPVVSDNSNSGASTSASISASASASASASSNPVVRGGRSRNPPPVATVVAAPTLAPAPSSLLDKLFDKNSGAEGRSLGEQAHYAARPDERDSLATAAMAAMTATSVFSAAPGWPETGGSSVPLWLRDGGSTNPSPSPSFLFEPQAAVGFAAPLQRSGWSTPVMINSGTEAHSRIGTPDATPDVALSQARRHLRAALGMLQLACTQPDRPAILRSLDLQALGLLPLSQALSNGQ